MFDFVEKNRFFVKFLLAAVIIGLVLGVGFTSYQVFSEPYLAKVGNVNITEQDVFEAAGGQNVTREERQQLLLRLIQKQLLLNAADELHIGASVKALQYALNNTPEFIEEGHFSAERYQAFLKKHQLTDQQYRKDLAQGLRIRALVVPIEESSFVSQTMLEQLTPNLLERRQVSVVRFAPEAYLKEASVSAADIKSYYEKHKKDFQLPERVRVAYFVLAEEGLAHTIEVTDKEIAEYEKSHRRDDLEERRARHILFQVPKNADIKNKAKIKDRALALLKQLQGNPKKFAELARLYSEDGGSAKAGGDLGFFKRGMMVPAFEEAVFMLKKGELSEIVETPFGFHIIQLEDIREPATQLLQNEAIAAIKEQKAKRQFLAEQAKVTEALSMAKDLESVAKAAKIGVKISDWLTKKNAIEPVLNHESMREAIFAADVVSGEYNTDLIEVQPGVLVAARVMEKQAGRQETLEEVGMIISAKLLTERAQRLAENHGKKVLADLHAGRPVKLTWTNETVMSRINPRLPPAYVDLTRQVFKVKKETLPAYVGAKLPGGGASESHEYVILQVTKVLPAEPQAITAEKVGIAQFYAQAELGRYLQYLQSKASITFPNIEQK